MPNLKIVDDGAYENCSSLVQVTFANQVEYIGDAAFLGTALEMLSFNGENPPALGENILNQLSVAMKSHDPQGELAQEVAKMHHRWLMYTWPSYSKEAHAGLAQMYVADERFTSYYDDAIGKGAAQFLCDAILFYTSCEE